MPTTQKRRPKSRRKIKPELEEDLNFEDGEMTEERIEEAIRFLHDYISDR